MSLNKTTFQRIALWMRSQAGVHLPPAKITLVRERLFKRLKARQMGSWEAYLRLLQEPAEERERALVVDLLTTHETAFFREARHFEWLGWHLRDWPGGQPFRAWSAACSTGEEVWTLAMVLAQRLGLHRPWSILGSDISGRVLEQAAAALYPEERIHGIPRELLERYCLKGRGRYAGSMRIDDALRKRASFREINLAGRLPDLGHFHLIVLRNVLIYFDAPMKAEIVDRLANRLTPDGVLFTGHSESLHGIDHALKSCAPGIYQKVHR